MTFFEEFRIRSRMMAERNQCPKCQGVTDLPFRAPLGTFLMVVFFLAFGFGFSTFTAFGNSGQSITAGVLVTAVGSIFAGGFFGDLAFKVFCGWLEMDLCRCRNSFRHKN